jgi:hypothetical protein
MWNIGAGVSLSFILGGLAGFSEIVSRYRDEPIRATANRFGAGYLVLNGFLSAAAFGFLIRYPKQIFSPLANDNLMLALAAGFGAMAIMRSKLFIFRGEDGKDYPIGPSIVMETFLRMLDRKIDRLRAAKRQQRVFDQMKDITDFDNVADYLVASMLSFQNLTDQEKKDLVTVIDDYRKQTDWPKALRTMAVGFAFLTLAGEENFDQVIGNLKTYLATLHQQEISPALIHTPPQGKP